MKGITEEIAVARLSELLALEHGYSPGVARQIRAAALFHDVGKQKIDGSIINKPGKLTAAEMELIKTHTTLGAGMLASIQGNLGVMARNICLWHHEFHNCGGYWGKAAGRLPPYIPMVSICDVYIALITERIYKSAWSQAAALEYIQNQAGTQFSHELTDRFCSLITGDSRVPAILSRKGGGK
jgi:putative two-component system response regulator